MVHTFSRSGVRFKYPTNWTLEADGDEAGGGWTATVQSPGTAFFLATFMAAPGSAKLLADESLAAMREEYPDLESKPAADTLAGVPAAGHDLDFLTLDASVTAWSRAADFAHGSLLILCQVGAYDQAANEPVLQAITASLTVSP